MCRHGPIKQMVVGIPGYFYGVIECYMASEFLLRSLHPIPKKTNRKNMINGLEELKKFRNGLNAALNISDVRHQTSTEAWRIIIRDDAFLAFPGPI